MIGKDSWVCVGSSISNSITISNDVIIGAGAVVVDNLSEPGTYAGIPARRIN